MVQCAAGPLLQRLFSAQRLADVTGRSSGARTQSGARQIKERRHSDPRLGTQTRTGIAPN
jgi:hypothetical protein